ncbi:hypothetical protein POM88_026722 [Heracleum sosnowskyi]|uniref:F-box domain-containing protein n=1 Tax=Heracleum sosnowskyi TaxID=360622 RepID=A0AAD8I8T3_9APIA|nr:hypothetical protein POM88_026722 [Heracleum sosnowskyi]
MKHRKDIDDVEFQKQSQKTRQTSNSKTKSITSQVRGIHHKRTHKSPAKRKVKRIYQWNDLSPDLLRLVIDKLNYEERIRFRVVCKGWSFIETSSSDFIHDIPLNVVAILMRLSVTRFKDFFNFYIYWMKGQTDTTTKALLDQIPIQ